VFICVVMGSDWFGWWGWVGGVEEEGGEKGLWVLSEKLGEGVQLTSQNSYPIYDQNL